MFNHLRNGTVTVGSHQQRESLALREALNVPAALQPVCSGCGPSGGCAMLAPLAVNEHFPNDSWRWASFPVLINHSFILPGEVFFFTSFAYNSTAFSVLLSSKISIFILGISPLSNTWLANIFSQSLGCLFILLMVSFEEKFLVLMRIHLPVLSCRGCAFGIWSKTS